MPGKRIELVKTVTNLGKAGKRAGAITRTPDGYLLTPGDGEAPKLNGRKLSGKASSCAMATLSKWPARASSFT